MNSEIAKLKVLKCLRGAIFAGLLVAFLWQTLHAYMQFSERRRSLALEVTYPDNLEFPSLSFCPVGGQPSPNNGIIQVPEAPQEEEDYDCSVDGDADDCLYSFATQLAENGPKLDFLLEFFHREIEGVNMSEVWTSSTSPLGSMWKIQPRVNMNTLNLTYCLTYRPGKNFSGGFDSMMDIALDTSGLEGLSVYIHHKDQRLLVPTRLYGTDIAPASLKHGMHYSFMIVPSLETVMPTQDLPCKPQPDNEDLMLCIEKFFERLANCSLVWVNHTDSLSKELQPCSSRKHWTLYTRLFIELNDHSAKDIYQMTGCFHTCTYYSYSTNLIQREKIDFDFQSMGFFLSPNGVTRRMEVLVYDANYLIGNIGGFLGLFLGASLLSIYDSILEKALKFVLANK